MNNLKFNLIDKKLILNILDNLILTNFSPKFFLRQIKLAHFKHTTPHFGLPFPELHELKLNLIIIILAFGL